MTEMNNRLHTSEKSIRYRGIGILMLCLLLMAAGIWNFQQGSLTVNSRVGERDLPIYCVDTAEKKVALSFDAAWGDARYGF